MCNVRYRADGADQWSTTLPMVWEDRPDVKVFSVQHGQEYRGSIVTVRPDTTYNVVMAIAGTSEEATLACTTWSEEFPVSRTVTVAPSTGTLLNITQGGSSTGYVLYTGTGPNTKLSMDTRALAVVVITVPYVILRGFVISGGSHAIRVTGTAHHVVIEENDVSGWGFPAFDGYGVDDQSAVRIDPNPALVGVVIQRNVLRDPATTASSWCDPTDSDNRTNIPPQEQKNNFHPLGPQGVTCTNCPGQMVIRYNRIDARIETDHYFNDGIGGDTNFAYTGFPGADSDVYGNWVGHTLDDSLEIEGGGMNVRIFQNYMNNTYTGVATGSVSLGPAYVFRNVMEKNKMCPRPLSYTVVSSGPFAKLGDYNQFGGGRRYMLHNMMLGGGRPGLGTATGPSGKKWMNNTWSVNNVWSLTTSGYSSTQACYSFGNGAIDIMGSNYLDYDMCSQNPSSSFYTPNGIVRARPVFRDGSWNCISGGDHTISCSFAQNSSSTGYDAGKVLPNINDGFAGEAPDIGAHEDGAPRILYGINANIVVPPSAATTVSSTTKTSTTATTKGSSTTAATGTTGTTDSTASPSTASPSTASPTTATPSSTTRTDESGATLLKVGLTVLFSAIFALV